jgi:sulfur carrier protein
MRVTLNGAAQDLSGLTTIAALVENATGTSRGSAVVIDGVVVPRSQWQSYQLREGQHVELITAVQGG